ncbi:MAG: SHOCT domain-containing protein [Actinomycetota bacterium]|nr:SHOCT domain-containing protein [Actinomycetota bacterium]
MMWYWGGGVHWWAWLLGFLGMVAFWGLLIWGLWYFFTGMSRSSPPEPPMAPPAKQILDERLARGELTPEDYRRLRDLMTGSNHEPAGMDRSGESTAGSAR